MKTKTTTQNTTIEQLKLLRRTLGLTQKDLADLLGISSRTVESWEAGIRSPGGTARKMLDMLAARYAVAPQVAAVRETPGGLFSQYRGPLSRDENLFLAKRRLVDNIYASARLEGVNVTFPQTQTILDGAIANGVSASDIQTVLNLKAAWTFVLQTIDDPFSLGYVYRINAEVSRNESLGWGFLREGSVSISGTKYRPPIPTRESALAIIRQALAKPSPEEQAIDYFCKALRAQFFWDGNKRTCTLAANKLLIQGGAGILQISEEKAESFNTALKLYYDTAEDSPLCEVLQGCIIREL